MIKAADLEKDCNSCTVCVAIGMFILSRLFFRNRSIVYEQDNSDKK